MSREKGAVPGQTRGCCETGSGKFTALASSKTEASDGYVPLHAVPAHFLREWRAQTPYAAAEDFVFPSLRAEGHVPLSASIFVADHLRPAARKPGYA